MVEYRRMTEADIGSVIHIQAECYVSSILEAEEVIRKRLRKFHETAWVAEDGWGIGAYLVAYRSPMGKITPLDNLFEEVDETDCLCLHDLAVSDRMKGQGIGDGLVAVALGYAMGIGLPYSSLVSVQNAQPFWRKFGYEVWAAVSPEQKRV